MAPLGPVSLTSRSASAFAEPGDGVAVTEMVMSTSAMMNPLPFLPTVAVPTKGTGTASREEVPSGTGPVVPTGRTTFPLAFFASATEARLAPASSATIVTIAAIPSFVLVSICPP